MIDRPIAILGLASLLLVSAGCMGPGTTTSTPESPTTASTEVAPELSVESTNCDQPENSDCRITVTVDSVGAADAIVVKDRGHGDTQHTLTAGDSTTIDGDDTPILVYTKHGSLLKLYTVYALPDSTETTDDTETIPRAGVDISQAEYASANSTTTATITVVTLSNADAVYIQATDGTFTNCPGTTTSNGCKLTTVGQHAELSGLARGETITVIAELNGKQAVIQTYDIR